VSVPSKAEANKVLRVLEGKPLNYTIRVYRASGVTLEFQSNETPKLKFDQELRTVLLFGKVEQYDGNTEYPMLEWHPGDIITCEKNPEAK